MDENLPTVDLFRTASQIPAMTSLSNGFASTCGHVFIVLLYDTGKRVFRQVENSFRLGADDADPEHALQPVDDRDGNADLSHKSSEIRSGLQVQTIDEIGEMRECEVASREWIMEPNGS